jgi:hypothetical protein
MSPAAPIMTSSEKRNTGIDSSSSVNHAFDRLEGIRAEPLKTRDGTHKGPMCPTQGRNFTVDAQLGPGPGIRITWSVSSDECVPINPSSSRPNCRDASYSPPSAPVTAQKYSVQSSNPAARHTQDSSSDHQCAPVKSPTITLDSVYRVPGAYPQSEGEDASD